MSQERRKTVVIIGASFAGLQVAHGLLKALQNRIKVVLINPSEKWYFNIAAPRIFAKPKAFSPDQYLLPFADSFAKYSRNAFEFIKGRATSIDVGENTVSVSVSSTSTPPNTVQVRYDYLVIASGSSTSSLAQGTYVPFKPTGDGDLEPRIREAQQAISQARSIVIGGAGPVGVEFAGEMAEAWASTGGGGTSITLVSATAHVLPGLKPAAGRAAEKLLAGHGVKLVRGRKVVGAVQQQQQQQQQQQKQQGQQQPQWIVSLDNGDTLTADVYVSSAGVTPNNDFIPAEFLTAAGWVRVDDEMRVVDQLRIYALGDITVHPVRTSLKVTEQVPVVVANLKADILGTTTTKRRAKYKPNNEKVLMMVPVGAASGTGQMMGMVPWGKMVAMVKGKDFFVSKAAGLAGLS